MSERTKTIPEREGKARVSKASNAGLRIGFLGVGWIGEHRMKAVIETGAIEAAFVSDANMANAENGAASAKLASAPYVDIVRGLDEMLRLDLDGIVIATPSALHAEQSIRALDSGAAVFCQKPLGRNAEETASVVSAARRADRLLAVDFSYRFVRACRVIRERLFSGAIGEVYAADLVFHNAYGPDKSWYYDRKLSGGGCVIDLGIHLVDLALWSLDFPRIENVTSRLFAKGRPFDSLNGGVEDFATARLDLANGATVSLACSWNLPAGRDAVIEATFYGTQGGLALRNVNGSFYDFQAEQFRGTARELLVAPPDAWGGRAATDWARRLADSRRYDQAIEQSIEVARALDAILKS